MTSVSTSTEPTPIMPGSTLLIWGAGGHAEVVADIVHAQGAYDIWGFLDDTKPSGGEGRLLGYPVFHGADRLTELYQTGLRNLIVAIGGSAGRARCAERAELEGFTLATAVHPRATVAATAKIGAGVVVAAGAVICAGVRLEKNSLVNSSANVDHGSIIGEGAHVSVGAVLGGRVRVGREAFIGMGATVLTGVAVGARALVGAGALVLEDVPPNVVAFGVPAKPRRERTVHDDY
jgi:UDP-N-acetylbacillosamine N-acetyltransferase